MVAEKDEQVKLPLATSCSPGWIKYIEHMYPEFLENLSTCMSPQQMFGVLVKTYYAKANKIEPDKIVSVSIMPCTAKKFEANRPEMHDSGFRDIDYVLTTRELAIMIKQAGINFAKLPDAKYDRLMGESTRAGAILGATGRVMEAALRTAYELVTGREVPFKNLDIIPVRGMKGEKEASIKIDHPQKDWIFQDGIELKCAIGHGLVNAKKVMDAVKKEPATIILLKLWLAREHAWEAEDSRFLQAPRSGKKGPKQFMPKIKICPCESLTKILKYLKFIKTIWANHWEQNLIFYYTRSILQEIAFN